MLIYVVIVWVRFQIKPAIVQKSQRKADQAKNVTLSAQEEVSRLSSLLEELKMDQEKKSEAVW